MSAALREIGEREAYGRRKGDVLPPHDDEAEINLLGTLFEDCATALTAAQECITGSEDFYDTFHHDVYRAIVTANAKGEAWDELSIRHRLEKDGPLTGAQLARLMSFRDGVHKGAPVSHYASIIAEKARLRRLGEAGDNLFNVSYNGADPDHLADIGRRIAEDLIGATITLPAEDAADVLARPILKTPVAVEGLWAEGDIVVESGPGGLGKSLVIVIQGLALAAGVKMFGRYRVTRRYRVAFLDLESRDWEMDQRLHRLAAGMKLDAENLRGLVFIIRRRCRLDVAADLQALLRFIKKNRIEFLFVDSMRRAFRGDGNKAEVISELFITALDRIRLETGCGVILTDHTRKRSGDPDLDSPDQMLHGSVDKRNAADTHVALEDRQGRLAFIPTKTRHTRKPSPVLLEIKGLGTEDPEDGPVTIECIGNLDAASDRVQDSIAALLMETGPPGMFRGEIIGRSGFGERSVDDGLSAMRAKGRISRERVGKQMRYSLQPQRPQTTADDSEAP